ncbi:carbohydrate ABC transporter permease [Paenibacillus koleovorans]|uniref:carbohydrate ABC transporter permease n=1 Tax=Paenibacillus koleovorans TaxID=121608 RepID=UPI000FD8C999|nr:carbohydrate ABC transporter permease [Paenibacillus koleovorans]
MKRTLSERMFEIINLLLLALLGLVTLYPFLYVLTISLSSPADIERIGLHIFPTNPTFEAYEKVLANPKLYTAYVNTIARTLLGLACVLLFTTLTAYPLARSTFPYRSTIMKLFVFSMLFSGGLIPTFMLVKQLGLLNTIWALVLPGAVSAFNIFVMRNFFAAVPSEMLESARIDGAGELNILIRIVVPLSVPVLAVIGLWAVVGHWNSWFDAMIYLNDDNKQVLQLFLRRNVIEPGTNLNQEYSLMGSTQVTPANLKSAIIMLVSLPILFAYPFIQRFFVKGIMLGSLKG